MRDSVDKGVMLLVAPDLPDKKNRIQHDAADDHGKQQEPEKEQDACMPVENNPADIQQNADNDEARAERDEESD